MIRIAINGAAGRMGRAVADAALDSDDLRVVGGVATSLAGGGLPGWPNAVTAAGCRDLQVDYDVIVDFSSPRGLAAAAEAAQGRGIPLVTGTTGMDDEALASLERASAAVPVVAAPNFSVGITILVNLVERAARAAGPDADVEIFEAHHRNKVDAPSGTALRLGEAVAAQRGSSLEEVACFDRRAERGPRGEGSIGFATLRAGDIIGEHQVLLALAGERLELGHRASDRGIFARGALRAARWVMDRRPGLYDMRNVLDL